MKLIPLANKSLLAVLLTLSAAACGSEFSDTASSAEGIYRVDSHNYNEASCAPGGESLITNESEGYAIAFMENVVGTDILEVISCSSPANCRDKLSKRRSQEGYTLDFGFTVYDVEGDLLTGVGASSGYPNDGQCVEGMRLETSMTFDETTISIELGETISDTFVQSSEGICWTDEALKAAKGNSCSRMETMTATFVEDL